MIDEHKEHAEIPMEKTGRKAQPMTRPGAVMT